MAGLTRQAVGTTHQPSVDDEAAADAGAEGDETRVVRPRRRAGPVLGDHRAGGVVLDHDLLRLALA